MTDPDDTVATLRALLDDLPAAQRAAAAAVQQRAASVLRPAGALDRLDAVAAWLASWQRTDHPSVHAPGAVVFAADHGVAAEGVSAYPADVTEAMVRALRGGQATAAVLADRIGASLDVVDVGVGRPTGNIRHEPALDADRFAAAVAAGVAAADRAADDGVDLLVLGEMGIANTTPAAALAAGIVGGSPADWVGRGTGIDDAGLATKAQVVAEVIERIGIVDPLELLRRGGGAELVAVAAATAQARHRSLPVVLDGFIITAAVAPLAATVPGALDHCIAAHRSAEPGHRALLAHLELEPLLDLDLRLGEASGALLVVPLIALAAAAVTDVATFSEFGLA